MMSVLNEETIQDSFTAAPYAAPHGAIKQSTTAQFTHWETLLKESSDGSLKLTNYRLTWKDSDTIIVLPVDAIDFIGYKKRTNWGLLIGGILMAFFIGPGLFFGESSPSKGAGFFMMLIGCALAFLSIKKFVVFATSGGEMQLKSDVLGQLDEWIDAVSAARDHLKYGS
jgi:hypothetical protein